MGNGCVRNKDDQPAPSKQQFNLEYLLSVERNKSKLEREEILSET